MLKKLIEITKRPTNINIIINTIGNYLGVFFTAFFALILVRILEPSQYGVLSVLLGIAYVLANILDFGTTATIYSYLPTIIDNKKNSLYSFIKSTFFFQSLFSLIVICLLLASFPFLDKVFFKTQAPVWELYLTAVSVLFLIWQNTATNTLFAAKKFFQANVITNIANVIKTTIILYLAYQQLVTVGSIIFVFGILGPVVFFLLLFWKKRHFLLPLWRAKIDKNEFRFRYTLTFFMASQFFNLGLRMDLFLLSYFLSKQEVGYYGLAQKVILTIITTIVSITQVLSPGFAKIKTQSQAKHQLKIGFIYMLIPSVIFLTLIIIPDFVFTLFFTSKFTPAIVIVKNLSLPFIIYAYGSIPHLFILYTIKKPIYNLLANILFFVIMTIGCLWLIPQLKLLAPVYVVAVALFVSSGVLMIATFKEIRRLPN